MATTTIRAYTARSAKQPLELAEYEAPELRDGEVRVAVTHCGVCHTDLHALDGDYGVFAFPLTPGHEIVGQVTEVGTGVTGLHVGDRVGVGWQGRCCGKCEWCRAGEEHLCVDIADCATWTPHGGFGSSVVVDGRFAYPLPAALTPETAAVLVCAGITVYAPLRRYTAPGSRVGVVGIGGLGHLALQFAHALGCEVTALSTSPGKEAEARSLGADHFLLTTDRQAMADKEFGFDLVLCTAPEGNDWATLVMILTKNGRLVLPAFSPVHLPLEAPRGSGPGVDFVVHQLSVTGSFLGSRADMREMLAFAREHHIAPQVELLPMSQVNEALARVRENRARYRVVLVNE